MYSVFVLGSIMIADSFGARIPEWLSPIATIGVIGYFFRKSIMEITKAADKKKRG